MKNKNTARVTVYMTDEQLLKIKEKAKALGMDLSTYLRFVALKDVFSNNQGE